MLLIYLIISDMWSGIVKFKIVFFFGRVMEVPYLCNELKLKTKEK